MFGDYHFRISLIELQIAYNLYLGSEKEIEDALYLWEIFRNSLNHHVMQSCMEHLEVSGEPYGISLNREKNRLERLEFIRSYAARVLHVPNREWSSQQAELIDAVMENAGSYALTCEQYLRSLSMRKSVHRSPPLCG